MNFSGHGSKDADLYANVADQESVMIPMRYTRYGISELVLQSCASAAPTFRDGWLRNVAVAGRFVGYLTDVNTINLNASECVMKGTNRP